eukprot:TRINITY_DN54760_c0_g1_i1.p1 TRINITY_DN54760_c0_g1~~TRINITY_DN54760_c0_g1_i1.p1  ORF type:complete len:237 (-),score=139.94 TRINITY_DN54760_c0_g1_i1:116-826(-)
MSLSHTTKYPMPEGTQVTNRRKLHGTLSYDVLVKMVIIGDSGVGKSALLRRFSDGSFSPSYVSTIGVDFEISTIMINDKVVKMQMWDTAGQERFHNITHSYYRGAHVVAIVVDVTDIVSLENVHRWMGELRHYGKVGVPVVLVANKVDLEQRRVVTQQMLLDVAERYDMTDVVVASAKANVNVEQAFYSAAHAYVNSALYKNTVLNKNQVVIDRKNNKELKKPSSLLQAIPCCKMM